MYEVTEHRDVNDMAGLFNNVLLFVGALVGLGVTYWWLGSIATQFYVVIVLVLAVIKIIFGWVVTLIRILGKFGNDNANVQADVIAAAAKPATEQVKLGLEMVKGMNQDNKASNDMQAILIKGLLANGFMDKLGPEFASQFSVMNSEPQHRIEQQDTYDDDDDQDFTELG